MRLPAAVSALLPLLWCLCSSAQAAEPAPSGKSPKKPAGKMIAPKLDLPAFGALPKGDDLVAPKAEQSGISPQIATTSASYTVLKLVHAKGFMRGSSGASPMGGPLAAIALSGTPPTTEKFTSVVRVKCKEKVGAQIELVVLDSRGDPTMSARGDFGFRGVKGDEVDYTVDWEPTATRGGGDYQVQVRIGGQQVGSYPLKMVEAAR